GARPAWVSGSRGSAPSSPPPSPNRFLTGRNATLGQAQKNSHYTGRNQAQKSPAADWPDLSVPVDQKVCKGRAGGGPEQFGADGRQGGIQDSQARGGVGRSVYRVPDNNICFCENAMSMTSPGWTSVLSSAARGDCLPSTFR